MFVCSGSGCNWILIIRNTCGATTSLFSHGKLISMAEVIRMPKMSDTMTEGVIVAWHKKVGDTVKPGEVLAEIETDKAVMEFESFQQGTLLYIGAEAGKTVRVDDVIAVLGKPGEDFQALLKEVVDADAGHVPVPAAASTVKEGGGQAVSGQAAAQATVSAAKGSTAEPAGRIKASPLARRMAEKAGVAIQKIVGTGDQGRVVKRDVEQFLMQAIPATEYAGDGMDYTDVPVSMMRKTIARRLSESMATAPHFYLTVEILMDRCLADREQMNAGAGEVKISVNDILIKAVAMALLRHPKVNSSWHGDTNDKPVIRYHRHVHMGVAVAMEEGLVVPVIRHADRKSLSQISAEMKQLAQRARERKLEPHEMAGSTFTISNLGMMGIEEFTAIINPPEACILAVGRIKSVPIVDKQEVRIASVMKVTLSCDHRLVDGATGADFLKTVKAYLENPLSMWL